VKRFDPIAFDRNACTAELRELKALLDSKPELKERQHILPFFKTHRQVSALIGMYNLWNHRRDVIAHELELFGDFLCDLAVGDSQSHAYCLVEFEDATSKSVFVAEGRHYPAWSPRYDHGFGQLIDWMWRISDQRQTQTFRNLFGDSDANIVPMLVIGRSGFLNEHSTRRLRWRTSNVQLLGAPTVCLTYDELFEGLTFKLKDVLPLTEPRVDAEMTKVHG
jgi:hypothetical protein